MKLKHYFGTLSGTSSDVTFDIFGIPSDILSGIFSDILSGISSDIHSGKPPDIFVGISADIFSGISSCIFFGIFSGNLSGVSSDIFLANFLALSGISSDNHSGILFGTTRGWGSAGNTATRPSRLRSGGQHCQPELAVEVRLELAVEVRRRTLPSGAGG